MSLLYHCFPNFGGLCYKCHIFDRIFFSEYLVTIPGTVVSVGLECVLSCLSTHLSTSFKSVLITQDKLIELKFFE